MRITTKGEYALRALFDLIISLKRSHVVKLEDIAKRQDIPLAYLEQIFRKLRKAKVVASLRGPSGGYNLLKTPEETKLMEVLIAVGDKPMGKPKAQKATTREAKKVTKILDLSDEAITKILNKSLADF